VSADFFRAHCAREKFLADAEVATKLCQRPCGHFHGERPEFSEAITRGKILADAKAANKLYQRACGPAKRPTIRLWAGQPGALRPL
jgi:hypothetical protein